MPEKSSSSSSSSNSEAKPKAKSETKPKAKSEAKPKTESEIYAIVEASGQQLWIQPKRYYDLDRIQVNVDETLTLDKVLLINDGKKTTLGKPYVKGASVELKVMAHRRGPKVLVYKMRPKKKTRRKNGHRQELTRVMVKSISSSSSSSKASTTKSSPTKASTAKSSSTKASTTKSSSTKVSANKELP